VTRPPGRSKIRLLRFQAGEVPLAVAADAVRSVGPPGPDSLHVAAVLGLESGSPEGRRSIELAHAGAPVRLLVDGPIGFDEATRARLLAPPPALPFALIPPVIGLLRDGDRIVLLVDTRLLARYASSPPT
jgi:hypothetical protein